jgi:hypothetical protein
MLELASGAEVEGDDVEPLLWRLTPTEMLAFVPLTDVAAN